MEIMIRGVKLEDASGVLTILNPIILHGGLTALDAPLTLKQEMKYIKQFPERGLFFVATGKNGKFLGFQSLEPFATYTHAFDHVATIGTYVDLSLRGRGIGTKLSHCSFERAKKKGYEKILTYILAENETALKFYINQGFDIIGRSVRQVKIKDRYMDEIIIEKFL